MKDKKRRWLVTMKCLVTKVVCCEDCTEEQARSEPFDHGVDEQETSQEDWTILSVEPNE